MYLLRQTLKNALSLLLLICFVPTSWAQTTKKSKTQHQVDSLNALIKTNISDQKKVDIYVEIVKLYFISDSAKTVFYANKAISLAKHSDYPEGVANTKMYQAWNYASRGKLAQAIRLLKDNFQFAKKINYPKGQGNALSSLGTMYAYQGDLDESLQMYHQALQIQLPQKDSTGMGGTYNNIGMIYLKRGAYPQALYNFLKGLKISEKTGVDQHLAEVYNNIGIVYAKQENNPKAIEYFKKSKQLEQKVGNLRGVAQSNYNIGKMYLAAKKPAQAQTHYSKGLEMVNNLGVSLYAFNGHIGLGDVAGAQKKYGQAIKHYSKALEVAEKLGSKEYQGNALILLGSALTYQKQYAQALEYLQKGLSIAQKLKSQEDIKRGSLARYEVYRAMGNHKKALKDYELYKQTSDSLSNNENTKKIANLNAQFAYDKKEDSLTLAQANERKVLTAEINAQKANQRTAWLGISLLTILVIVLGLFYRSKQRSNRLLSKTNQKLVVLDQFKQQMMGLVVHDLKNPLNAIIGLSENQSLHPNLTAIHRSGTRMHHLVMNILDVQKMEDSHLSLQVKATSLQNLVQAAVAQVQFITEEKNQQIVVEPLSGIILKADHQLMTRVLVNLLTNATKYTPANHNIWIKAEKLGTGQCKIFVQDEGVGIAPELIDKIFDRFYQASPQKSGAIRSTGLGLTFCKLAVEAHGGKIGVASKTGQGATFWFTITMAGSETETTSTSQDLSKSPFSSNNLSLDNQALNILQPLIAQIRQYEIFQTGEIMQEIQVLDNHDNPSLHQWRIAFEQALLAHNELKIEELFTQAAEVIS